MQQNSPNFQGALLSSHLHWPPSYCRRFWPICHFCQIRQIRQICRLYKGALLPSHLHWPPSCCRRFWPIFHFCQIRQIRQNRRLYKGALLCLLICIGLQVVVGEILPFLPFLLLCAFLEISQNAILSMKTLIENIVIWCCLVKYSFLTPNANINGIELENSNFVTFKKAKDNCYFY